MPSALSVLKYKYCRSVTIIVMLILTFSKFHKMYCLLIMSVRSSEESFVKANPWTLMPASFSTVFFLQLLQCNSQGPVTIKHCRLVMYGTWTD